MLTIKKLKTHKETIYYEEEIANKQKYWATITSKKVQIIELLDKNY